MAPERSVSKRMKVLRQSSMYLKKSHFLCKHSFRQWHLLPQRAELGEGDGARAGLVEHGDHQAYRFRVERRLPAAVAQRVLQLLGVESAVAVLVDLKRYEERITNGQ